MRSAFLLCVTLLAVSFAGCFQAPGSTIDSEDEPYVITRVVRVHVDGDNIQRLQQIADNPTLLEEYRYDFLDPQLVIRVNKDTDAKTLTFTFTDRTGVVKTQPVSLLTGAEWLNPGSTVVIPAHMFSGGILKDLAGNVLADRTVDTPAWWTVGGYPIGAQMTPGSELVYDIVGDVSQRFSLTAVKPTDESFPYFLDSAVADLAVKNRATLSFAYRDASETITAEERHQARPLAFSIDGSLRTPLELSFSGRNLTTGRVISGGVEALDTTGFAYSVDGSLWWNDTNAPVRGDIDLATMTPKVDVIAWLTGMPEAEGDFSCASKSRLDRCRPDEIPYADIEQTQSFGPESENLDGWTPTVDAAILRDLEQFLADDLRAGDEIAYRIDLKGHELPGYDEHGRYPEKIEFESITRVLGRETVTVAAGTFETYKADQMMRIGIVTPEQREADGTVFKRLEVQQKVIESSIWIDRENFLVVKSIATAPFNVGRVLDDVLDAVDAKMWAGAPIERLTSANVEFTATSTQTMELTKATGTSRLAPWVLIGGLPLFFLAEEGIPAYLLESGAMYGEAGAESYAWSG